MILGISLGNDQREKVQLVQWTLDAACLLALGADLSSPRQSLSRELKEVFPSSTMIDRYPSWL